MGSRGMLRHAVSRDKNAWPDPCLYCQLREEEAEEEEEEKSALNDKL